MKKYIGLAITLIAVTAFAGIETSGLYQEYVRREALSFTSFEKATMSKLQLSGVKPKDLVVFSADETTQTFKFENTKDEVCTGSYVNAKVQYTCAPKYTGEDTKILNAIYANIPKDKIVDMEIYSESGKYIFQTIDKEICHGEYMFGQAQFTCFTKAGVLSFFAGGDSD